MHRQFTSRNKSQEICPLKLIHVRLFWLYEHWLRLACAMRSSWKENRGSQEGERLKIHEQYKIYSSKQSKTREKKKKKLAASSKWDLHWKCFNQGNHSWQQPCTKFCSLEALLSGTTHAQLSVAMQAMLKKHSGILHNKTTPIASSCGRLSFCEFLNIFIIFNDTIPMRCYIIGLVLECPGRVSNRALHLLQFPAYWSFVLDNIDTLRLFLASLYH